MDEIEESLEELISKAQERPGVAELLRVWDNFEDKNSVYQSFTRRMEPRIICSSSDSTA